jgi:hypothetical protein
MTAPQTILDTIAMLRRRMLEIDRIIERLERERTSPHPVNRHSRHVSRKAVSHTRKAG